eukprot:jgi/Botrbrau1/15930/Bobra.0253s0005.1
MQCISPAKTSKYSVATIPWDEVGRGTTRESLCPLFASHKCKRRVVRGWLDTGVLKLWGLGNP